MANELQVNGKWMVNEWQANGKRMISDAQWLSHWISLRATAKSHLFTILNRFAFFESFIVAVLCYCRLQSPCIQCVLQSTCSGDRCSNLRCVFNLHCLQLAMSSTHCSFFNPQCPQPTALPPDSIRTVRGSFESNVSTFTVLNGQRVRQLTRKVKLFYKFSKFFFSKRATFTSDRHLWKSAKFEQQKLS